MYSYNDAWVLTSLLLNRKWSNLEDLIATGDLINHAIMETSEINESLSRLVYDGYVEIESQKMRPTRKALRLRNIRYFIVGLFGLVDQILNQLNKKERVRLNELKYEKFDFFSNQDAEQAFKQYSNQLIS